MIKAVVINSPRVLLLVILAIIVTTIAMINPPNNKNKHPALSVINAVGLGLGGATVSPNAVTEVPVVVATPAPKLPPNVVPTPVVV